MIPFPYARALLIRRAAQAGGGVPSANVKSLLHFDGANGSTTITDETGRAWAAVGNAQISTARSKFGSASLLLDGTGDYAETADAADLEPAALDFCAEGFFYNAGTNAGLFSKGDISDFPSFEMRITDPNTLVLAMATAGGWYLNNVFASGSIVPANAFFHLALCRAGANLAVFLNGTRSYSRTDANVTLRNTSGSLKVGYAAFNGAQLNGNCDEFRYVVGNSVYDPTQTTITVPTAPFSYP